MPIISKVILLVITHKFFFAANNANFHK